MINISEKVFPFNLAVHCYQITVLLLSALAGIFRRPTYFKLLVEQMEIIGVRSLSIVLLTCLFTGMVLALEIGFEISRYGAKFYIGNLVALSMVKQLGPVLTGVVVAGRVGSGIAAELGSMQVTEQIDAMRAMATDPIKKLVTTRLIALLIMMPVLTVLGDFVGMVGGMLIANSSLGIDFTLYITSSIQALTLVNIFTSIVKAFVFGLIVAMIGCYLGLRTTGGTQGVGKATTVSVVASMILIFLFNFLLAKIFFLIFEV